MIKNLLFTFLLIAMVNLATAQANLVFTPETVEVIGEALPDNYHRIEGHGTLTNEGDETITIRWERVVIDAPVEWEYQVCDLHQCYSAAVYSNIAPDLGLNVPVTLAPGEATNMDVYALPKGVAGEASVEVEITDVNNQDEVLLTAQFGFEATTVSDLEDQSMYHTPITVFPNPTVNYFEVKGTNDVDRIVVYNIIGREIRSFNAAPGKRYNVNNLPNGLYLVSLVSNENGILKTLRLSKNASRP